MPERPHMRERLLCMLLARGPREDALVNRWDGFEERLGNA